MHRDCCCNFVSSLCSIPPLHRGQCEHESRLNNIIYFPNKIFFIQCRHQIEILESEGLLFESEKIYKHCCLNISREESPHTAFYDSGTVKAILSSVSLFQSIGINTQSDSIAIHMKRRSSVRIVNAYDDIVITRIIRCDPSSDRFSRNRLCRGIAIKLVFYQGHRWRFKQRVC